MRQLDTVVVDTSQCSENNRVKTVMITDPGDHIALAERQRVRDDCARDLYSPPASRAPTARNATS